MKEITLRMKTIRSETAEIYFNKEFEDVVVRVGDGATVSYYSDSEPCTIIDIADNGAWIKVQFDKAIRTDTNGVSECQHYKYERNENGRIEVFKRTRKDHSKYTTNGRYDDYGARLLFGFRIKYHDYSF